MGAARLTTRSANALAWYPFDPIVRAPSPYRLNRLFSRFIGSNTDGLVDIIDKDFAVSDFASLCCFHDRDCRAFDDAVREDHLNFDLGEKINRIFATAVDFSVAFLASETLYLRDCHSFDP